MFRKLQRWCSRKWFAVQKWYYVRAGINLRRWPATGTGHCQGGSSPPPMTGQQMEDFANRNLALYTNADGGLGVPDPSTTQKVQ